MGKIRDHFKKIKGTKGTFHAKMGTIKARNGMDLSEEKIRKKWQEYTENYTKKVLMTQITMMVWSIDIQECKVKWEASLQTKLVEVIKFKSSYFKS